MEKDLKRNIKEIIEEFPEVGNILDKYGIGCTSCGLGTCQLNDIIEIHNLPIEKENELMKKIAEVMYPGKDVKIPLAKRKVKPDKLDYSPPMRRLVEEHKLIKRLLALIPCIVERLDIKTDKQLVKDVVDFIRSYADKFHHAKEEDILFKYFDPNLDILKVIYEDHEKGRAHVKAILQGLNKNDADAIKEYLLGYMELLKEHIKKEDEILYPWMDRGLTDKDIGELFSKFIETDNKAEGVSEKYNKFIDKLENKYKK